MRWLIERYLHLLSYVVLLAAVVLLVKYSPRYVHPAAEMVMLLIPYLVGPPHGALRWDWRAFASGAAVTVLVLALYVGVVAVAVRPEVVRALLGGGFDAGPLLRLAPLMAVVAFGEEFFFRGFLQGRLGMNAAGVVGVSALFAAGHFVVAVLGGGRSPEGASAELLTFFPSLVMGWMYVRYRTLWPGVLFHFLSNMVYLAVGGPFG